ncbi:hypothetical protein C8A03DRAFT_33380 [Achaetomium macrosporum]|uniref:Uncharacterized protein n=1 Tax=Achaetomium macrosporum TaxID=79813 RepID=A0AAN7CCN7_9PEZI|nr:hypothetical protein C8A03DRAFT_33380 [Achaetomium macrosporum]
MDEREAKKQRLRELRDTYPYVKTIVNHMGKHYRAVAPPAWLDLREVAGQLMRSTQTGSKHPAWGSLKRSLVAIIAWRAGRNSWEEAVKVARMPYIGTRSEVKSMEFIYDIHCRTARLPNCLLKDLKKVELDFLLESERRSHDKMPGFWKGADVEDPNWRRAYMEEPIKRYNLRLPFNDDLTDLVLSTVCRRPEPDKPLLSTPARVGKEGDGASDQAAGTKEDSDLEAEVRNGGVAGMWESEVQAIIARIADTVHTTLETEKVRLLGKRDRQEVETVQLHKRQKTVEDVSEDVSKEVETTQFHKKQQKTVEDVPNSPKPINTIEDNDGDGSPASYTARAAAPKEERYRALKTSYKKLKNHNRQLTASLAELNDKYKKLSENAELMALQYKDLRSDYDTSKEKVRQLANTCGRQEEQTKTLMERGLQLVDQSSAFSEAVKQLDDKSGQLAAQGTALKDENVIMRAQIVSLLARVDTLERSAAAQARQSQTRCAGPGPAEGLPNNRHDAGSSTLPGSQGQSNGASKHDSNDSLDLTKVPLYRKPTVQPGNRASSRFPCILEMPTFDLEESPQEESSRRSVPAVTNARSMTTHTDTTITTPSRLTTTHSHANPAAEGSNAALSPTCEPLTAPAPAQMLSTATAPPQMPIPAPAPAPAAGPTAITQTSTSTTEALPSTVATTQQLHPHPGAQPEAQSKEHTAKAPVPNHIQDATANNTEIARLSPARREQVFSFLRGLDQPIWTTPTQEIVACCRANGMEYDRLDDLVEEFKIIVGGYLGVVDAEGRWIGGADGEGQGEGDVSEGLGLNNCV